MSFHFDSQAEGDLERSMRGDTSQEDAQFINSVEYMFGSATGEEGPQDDELRSPLSTHSVPRESGSQRESQMPGSTAPYSPTLSIPASFPPSQVASQLSCSPSLLHSAEIESQIPGSAFLTHPPSTTSDEHESQRIPGSIPTSSFASQGESEIGGVRSSSSIPSQPDPKSPLGEERDDFPQQEGLAAHASSVSRRRGGHGRGRGTTARGGRGSRGGRGRGAGGRGRGRPSSATGQSLDYEGDDLSASRRPTPAQAARQKAKRDGATAGWVTDSIPQWELVDEDTFLQRPITERFIQHHIHVLSKLERKFEVRRETDDDERNNVSTSSHPSRADFVILLLEPALHKLTRMCNDAMPAEVMRTNPVEFMRFLGTLVGISTMKVSPSMAHQLLTALKWPVLPEHRYKEILRYVRAYSSVDRDGSWDGGWLAQGDLTPNLSAFEALILEESRRLLLNIQNSCLVLDDELVASRSQDVQVHRHLLCPLHRTFPALILFLTHQVKSLNARKAGKEGHSMDVVADSFTRIVFATRLKRRGAEQDESVKKLLETLKEEQQGSWRGGMVTMDRGYCKPQLVEAVLRMGLGCAFIVPDHLANHHPFCTSNQFAPLARTHSSDADDISQNLEPQAPDERSSKWIIPDAPLLGPMVYSASKTVAVSGESRVSAQKVHAIAVRERGDKKSTKVLRFYISWPTIPPFLHKWMAVYIKGSNGNAKDTLFYPSDDRSNERIRIEDLLVGKVTPLTAGQRCADWFIARAHRCTGTMARFVAKYDVGARFLLNKEQVESTSTLPTNSELMTKFTTSWYSKATSTDEMRQGTKNEGKIIEALKGRPDFILSICEVGLLQHKEKPWLAVSPDAIALIRHPGTGEELLATVELKTAVASSAVEELVRVAGGLGRLLSAKVGDEVWWQSVPPDHRAQVLHQMYVCGLNHALYVKATTTRIGYMVLVHASDEQLDVFGESLSCLEEVLGWAHEVIPRIPAFVGREDKEIISSHLPFWRMVNSSITANGPSKPVLLYRHAAQALYSKTKGGLDGSSEYHAGFSPNAGSLDFERKFVLRSIFTVFFNAAIMWRMWQRRDLFVGLASSSSTLRRLRDALNHVESINDFMKEVAEELCDVHYLHQKLLESFNLSGGHQDNIVGGASDSPLTVTDHEAIKTLQAQVPKYKKLKFFATTEAGIKLRLQTPGHLSVRPKVVDGRPVLQGRSCELCNRKTVFYCPVCGVFLCTSLAPQARVICTETFHKRKKLPIEKVERQKRPYRKRELSSGEENESRSEEEGDASHEERERQSKRQRKAGSDTGSEEERRSV